MSWLAKATSEASEPHIYYSSAIALRYRQREQEAAIDKENTNWRSKGDTLAPYIFVIVLACVMRL